MQIYTFVGLVISVLIIGYTAGDTLVNSYDQTMLLLVVGGGVAATLIAYSLCAIRAALGAAWYAFVGHGDQTKKLIKRLVTYAETARREGILVLEKSIVAEPHPFLAAGIRLVVDGTEPRLIMDILETELRFSKERQVNAERVLEGLGRHWVLFGLVGGLLALVEGGSAVAAGLPLLYGVLLYGLIGGALARKLGQYHEKERLMHQMIIEGIVAIQAGDNPRLIEHKITVFLAPKNRPSSNETPEPLPPSTAPTPDIAVEELHLYVEKRSKQTLVAIREAVDQSNADHEEKEAVTVLLSQVERGEMGFLTLLASLESKLYQVALDALQHSVAQTVLVHKGMLERELDFDSLADLNDQQIQLLLREIDQRDLVIALKGASPAVREKILSNMSERIRVFISEEMSFMHCGVHDVLDAQARIVRALHMLLGNSETD